MQCVTCQTNHENKFCPNCGEKADVPTINFASIFNSAFSTISNMDKGFLFNLKQLTINPKEIVDNYLNGRRKNILNPISYLIIAVTLFLIIESIVHVPSGVTKKPQGGFYNMGYVTGKFISTYSKYFWITSLLWLSLSTRLVFKKNTLAEHMVINSFILGHTLLAAMLSLLIYNFSLIFNPLIYLIIIWMTYKVHKRKDNDVDIFLMSFTSTMFYVIFLAMVILMIGFTTY